MSHVIDAPITIETTEILAPITIGEDCCEIINTTYDDLFGEGGQVSRKTLRPGRKYSFQHTTRFFMPGAGNLVTYEGTPETLICTAIDVDKVDVHVQSLDYPEDVIKWTPSNTQFEDKQSITGAIMWREYQGRLIVADFDFRNLVCRCWKRDKSDEIYSGTSDPYNNPLDPEYGLHYKDFPLFVSIPDYDTVADGDFGSIHLLTHRNGDRGTREMPFMVFQSQWVYKVRLEYGNDICLFVGPVSDTTHGNCEPFECEGYIRDYFSAPSCGPDYCTGNLTNVNFLCSVNGVYGSLRDCTVLGGYDRDPIHGDHRGVVFGPRNEGPGILGEELLDDPTFENLEVDWGGNSIYADGTYIFGDGTHLKPNTDLIPILGATYIIEISLAYGTALTSELIAVIGGITSDVITGRGLHRFEITIGTESASPFRINENETGGGAIIKRTSVRRKHVN